MQGENTHNPLPFGQQSACDVGHTEHTYSSPHTCSHTCSHTLTCVHRVHMCVFTTCSQGCAHTQTWTKASPDTSLAGAEQRQEGGKAESRFQPVNGGHWPECRRSKRRRTPGCTTVQSVEEGPSRRAESRSREAQGKRKHQQRAGQMQEDVAWQIKLG